MLLIDYSVLIRDRKYKMTMTHHDTSSEKEKRDTSDLHMVQLMPLPPRRLLLR